MKKTFPLLIFFLSLCSFASISFDKKISFSTAILASTKGIPTTGTLQKKPSKNTYYYLQINRAFINKAYEALQTYLIKQHQTCFHKPTDLHDAAHISVSTHYSPELTPYLGKTFSFKLDKVIRITTTKRVHHRHEKQIWYAIQVHVDNAIFNKYQKELQPNNASYRYHISFAVAKYDAEGQCIPHTTVKN